METVVLAESVEEMPASASARDIAASAEAARLAGCRVYRFPPDFSRCGDADAALCHVPRRAVPTPAYWLGYIPSRTRYAAVYEAALARNLVLPNTPEEHLNAQEFDRAYPRLGELTPASVVIRSPDEAPEAAARLGLPVFVKGAVQSRKARGLKACVAETVEELAALTGYLLELDNRSRGRVIVRQWISRRHERVAAGGFPLGREYRVFWLRGDVIGQGYYWEGDDPLSTLTPEESEHVLALAREAAQRVETPYMAVDIGQEERGTWCVIETGDAQFSGLSRIAPLALWNRIRAARNVPGG